MSIEIKVPALPESVSDAAVAKWYKKPGDAVARDEHLVDLETDKVMLEVPAPEAGILESISMPEGSVVKAGVVIGILKAGSAPAKAEKLAEKKAESVPAEKSADLAPSARRTAAELNVDASQVQGSGKNNRVTSEDIKNAVKPAASSASTTSAPVSFSAGREEKRVPMSRLRARIAERLVDVQHQAALLTTFNEVNMKPIMDLRNRYKDVFEKSHKTKLGFMSFFTKACVEALKKFPVVNASIDGNDILYHNYFDVGIAVGSSRGLVVPILRDADQMSMAQIEQKIREYATLANDGKLTMDDMTGGTFTITNGGTYGSMLSTPIINAPQSAILGMHNIVERVVVENGEMVIRPMMYLALSYDHRIIDGKEAVQFLVLVKTLIEDPARMLLEI